MADGIELENLLRGILKLKFPLYIDSDEIYLDVAGKGFEGYYRSNRFSLYEERFDNFKNSTRIDFRKEGKEGFIDYISVLPQLRKNGYGPDLFNSIEAFLKCSGCMIIKLNDIKNERFVNSLGYLPSNDYSKEKELIYLGEAVTKFKESFS